MSRLHPRTRTVGTGRHARVETTWHDRYGIPHADSSRLYRPPTPKPDPLARVAFPAWAPLTPCRT